MAEHYLPEDILVRIFERLPVRSLIRFTCLSKRWHFIILSDPLFAKSQFQIASQHRSSRLLSKAPTKTEFELVDWEYQRDFVDLGDSGSSSLRKLNCPYFQEYYHDHNDYYLCTCNGLVCILTSNETIRIWNPSTGFYKNYDSFPDVVLGYEHFGFGYVSSVDDYKVITNSYTEGEEVFGNITMSLKANNWKNMGPNCYRFNSASALLNESIHWINGNNGGKDIVVFDLGKEEFRTMLIPAGLAISCLNLELVTSVEGCLCLMNLFLDSLTRTEVWVMKEYDVSDSWTKLFSLDFSTHPEFFPRRLVRVTETSAWVELYEGIHEWHYGHSRSRLIRSGHDEEEICIVSRLDLDVIEYQETLIWLP